ncbi:MAG: hypothetical protein F6K63_04850 [Moorea sp. SIO1G6]|uniref:COP23 domain-containing protein n=1 Tax=Moorena sp. SIO1G6 TaxID=2607840 RepID=UPI0013C29999|nr:COP23 domain-containing protein [Moorena sp. SIO1G6]NET63760.1 hypothetical protein [Moorena sp. SIO1G6]
MNLKSIAKYIVTGLAFYSVITLTSQPLSAKDAPTARFKCIRGNIGWDTVVVRLENGQEIWNSPNSPTPPIINWQSQALAANGYTPEKRCYQVTNTLNRHYANNGYKMSNIRLTTGSRKGYDVLCVVYNFHSGCNESNHLMNIILGNYYKNSGDALADLSNRLRDPVVTGHVVQQNSRRYYLELGKIVEEKLFGSSTRPTPTPTPTPNPTQGVNSEGNIEPWYE